MGDELKTVEKYFKKRIIEENYRHKKHLLYNFQSDRPNIIATLKYELELVQSEIKRI